MVGFQFFCLCRIHLRQYCHVYVIYSREKDELNNPEIFFVKGVLLVL